MLAPHIRLATTADAGALRQAIVALQEHERRLHASRLPGEQIADAYLASIVRQTTTHGALLVAEIGGQFAGFVSGWIEQDAAIAETPESRRFAYISDIFVTPSHRGRGLAGRLLQEIEHRLVGPGIERLRVASLAANTAAERAYRRAGFLPYEITHEKPAIGSRFRIREERATEAETIRALIAAAFATAPHADGDEADFVERQRASDDYIPDLALVAEDGTAIVGQILLSRLRFGGALLPKRALLLAILSVAPPVQRSGLGTRLVRDALARARVLGFEVAIVLGDPAFYHRFGFRSAADFRIANTNGFPDENVMALAIEPGALVGTSGTVTLPD